MQADALKRLPPDAELETKRVLKQLIRAHRALAELKGFVAALPNKNAFIHAVMINEAKDSSEMENIITTHDELFRAMSQAGGNPVAQEVVDYRTALWRGCELVQGRQMITTNMIVGIQQIMAKNRAGIRKLPGTVLQNQTTGEVVYTPPGGEREILDLLSNLEQYMNNDEDAVDPLIKLAVVHYQFEAIHPFYDGNGRSGRIINIMYLILQGLLDSPVLHLSKYIVNHKRDYYRLLQDVRAKDGWEAWILYMLDGIAQTAAETLLSVKRIKALAGATAGDIKAALPRVYSEALVDLLFDEFYIQIASVEQRLGVSRQTAASRLAALEKGGILVSQKIGKERVYFNKRLFDAVQETGF